MDEKRREKIRVQAKEILANFAKKLESVKFKEKKEKRELGGFREEGEGKSGDSDFIERMFENAPEKDGECIIVEKKEWQ